MHLHVDEAWNRLNSPPSERASLPLAFTTQRVHQARWHHPFIYDSVIYLNARKSILSHKKKNFPGPSLHLFLFLCSINWLAGLAAGSRYWTCSPRPFFFFFFLASTLRQIRNRKGKERVRQGFGCEGDTHTTTHTHAQARPLIKTTLWKLSRFPEHRR